MEIKKKIVIKLIIYLDNINSCWKKYAAISNVTLQKYKSQSLHHGEIISNNDNGALFIINSEILHILSINFTNVTFCVRSVVILCW